MDAGSSPAATSELVLVVPNVILFRNARVHAYPVVLPNAITSVTRCKPIHGRSAKTSMLSMVTAAIAPVSLLSSIQPCL
ncbi:hypothetical protein [Shewanella frigidimarina]|uniref:hypothetical protein n=1 Tax=Shewanella frigidimarina TaxID=56812 RepID=UPI001232D923|nr:hypothetical protein [Shewanella frigidimarina]